jgi:chromosome segregation ATPase
MAKIKQWIEEYRQLGTDIKKPEAISFNEEARTESINNVESAISSVGAASTTPAIAALKPAIEVQLPTVEKKVEAPGKSARIVPVATEEFPADMANYLVDLLDKAGKAAAAVKTEGVQQKNRIDTLSRALESEQEKLQHADQQIADQQATITELRKKLDATEGDVFVLRQTVEQRDAVIAEKDAEIAERIKMADVLSRDRSKQADESLQRLASKIRVEYRDFVDALDVPMSCDLGENLRLQIQSIFDILEKGGMKIK